MFICSGALCITSAIKNAEALLPCIAYGKVRDDPASYQTQTPISINGGGAHACARPIIHPLPPFLTGLFVEDRHAAT